MVRLLNSGFGSSEMNIQKKKKKINNSNNDHNLQNTKKTYLSNS